MEFFSFLFQLICIMAVVAGPFVLVMSIALGKDALIAGLVLTIGGNAFCIGAYGMEPVFYLKWIGA